MTKIIRFGDTSFMLSRRLMPVCKHYDAITFRGFDPNKARAEGIIDAFNGLSSLNPESRFTKTLTLEVVDRMASIDSLFNPRITGHNKLELEIWRNPVRDEIVAMRWTTLREKDTDREITLGTAFVLTGAIDSLMF